ncbi:MAG: hypothetical protein RCO49_07250 [Rickettsia endosymbiont of Argas persicus]
MKITKKYGIDPVKIPPAIHTENANHKKIIADCDEQIKKVEPVHTERDRERKYLLELAKEDPKKTEELVKNHYKRYNPKYKKLKQADPNHKGLDELDQLVKLCGGHEKLGLDKSDTPAQGGSPPAKNSPQTKKQSSKIVEKPVKDSIFTKFFPPEVCEKVGKVKKALTDATAKSKSSQNALSK